MHMLVRLLLAVFLISVASLVVADAAGRRVAASDVIQIHVLNQPDLDTQVRVAPDGTISFPLYQSISGGWTDRGCDCSADPEGTSKRWHRQMSSQQRGLAAAER
jgi:hypothetical protein